ncbi:uncharacterized protein LOC116665535 [Camelus ferus]|uniref:Uncharacterized protein LOC116665535 n=1 Tax=Camelus ferus TaxID=419612 RepID=A0A8B8THS5_CAMFR|nr:uncharacterized protein LOC116665535 [Camelus ferus]
MAMKVKCNKRRQSASLAAPPSARDSLVLAGPPSANYPAESSPVTTLAEESAVRPAAARGSLRARGASPELCGARARGAGRGRRRGRGGRREGPRQLQSRAAVRLHVTATQNRARPPSGILRVWEVSASSVPTIGAGGAPLTRGPVAAEELSSPPRDSERMARPPRRGHVAAPELLVSPAGTTLVFLSEAAISILFWLIQALSGPRCGDRELQVK